MGFEPTRRSPAYNVSNVAPSTTRTPLLKRLNWKKLKLASYCNLTSTLKTTGVLERPLSCDVLRCFMAIPFEYSVAVPL